MAYVVAFRKTPYGIHVGGLGKAPVPHYGMYGLAALGDDSTKLSTGEWAAIGAAALLAIGGGVYLGIRSRRKSSAMGWMSYPGRSRRRRRR